MTGSYALGSASRSYGVGEPPEQWPAFNSLHLYAKRAAPPGYSALYVRYVVNDKAPAAGHAREDHWDEGQHVAVQHRNRAIVAYGLMPRFALARSYKLSIRMLGVSPGDDVWVDDRRIDAWPARVGPEQRVVIGFGDAYVALIPLAQTDMGSDAPIELNLVDGVLTLDIYNYRGPGKTFWEYRSHGGPFFKGNVRNAFAIEAADRADFATIEAFRTHIAASTISDITNTGHHRTIEYASDGGSVALTYSRWDMSLIERHHDGTIYTPPPATVGAIDGSGPQFVQTADATTQLGRVTLHAATTPHWLIADDEARRYIAINPSNAAAPLHLTTPTTEIACKALPLARIDLDEANNIARIDTATDPGEIRATPTTLRLIINGVESGRSR
jgi:hypothetical protein